MQAVKIVMEHISIWIILVPLFTGSWLIKKLSRDSFLILTLVAIATPPQLVTAFFSLNSGTLNLFYNIYTPCEFLILFILFKPKFLGRRNNIALISSGVLYFAASAFFVISFSLAKAFIAQWPALNNILYIVWVLMYVTEIFFFDADKVSSSNPFTYFLLGIFFYAQCSVLLFALYHYITKNIILGNTWIIQSIANITMYLLFTAGFIIDAKNKASKPAALQ